MEKHKYLMFSKLFLLIAVLVLMPKFSKVQSQVILQDSIIDLEEVMIIGYATGSQSTISGVVDKIKEEKINKGLILSPLDAIRGKIAGVNITPANNGPAVLSSVRIRGTTSLTGGNDPLIIVDGVFGNMSTLNSIYPGDIESFTILKDASETAQYGSRGASGVIEIITKKGSDKPFNVSYYGNISIDRSVKNLKMLSANQYRQLAKERNLEIVDLGYDTDFAKEMTHTGLIHNHHIAFGSGTKTSNYRVSAGFIDKEGVIRNNQSKNYSTKIDLRQMAWNNRLTVDIGAFGSILKNNYLFDFQKTFYSASAFNPTFPNHKNKETGNWDQLAYASQITNPLAWLEVDDDEDNSLVNTHANLKLFLTNDLKLIT
ncbi:MAG: TonB-dependent receptor plug domain-containing protein [Bacteroidales bacterium]|nr:TonB-dependent receptor plug domain-containing protein [Bacteroidales bacterium]